MHGLLRCRTGHTGSQVGDTRSSDNADANIPLYVSVVAEYNFWKKNTVKIKISLLKVLRRALDGVTVMLGHTQINQNNLYLIIL